MSGQANGAANGSTPQQPEERAASASELRYGVACQRFANALARKTQGEGGIDVFTVKLSVELTAGFLDELTEYLSEKGLIDRDEVFARVAARFDLSAAFMEKPSLVIAQGGMR